MTTPWVIARKSTREVKLVHKVIELIHKKGEKEYCWEFVKLTLVK